MLSREISEESFRRINVPGDSSCLFWAITLAYLIPVKCSNDAFRERFERLFGGNSVELLQVQKLIQDRSSLSIYNDGILKKLVTKEFRGRVVDKMFSDQDRFEKSITVNDFLNSRSEDYVTGGTFQERFRSKFRTEIGQYNIDIDKLKPSTFNEAAIKMIDIELSKIPDKNKVRQFKFRTYLKCMRDPKVWGGDHEIQAISRLLQCEIVTFSNQSRYSTGQNDDRQIHLFNDNEIHYHFGLIKVQVLIKSIKDSEWDKVKRYLGFGIDKINYQDSRGRTAFDLANQRDDAEINQLLLNQGASAASTLTAVDISGSRSVDAVNRENTVEAPQDCGLIQLLIQEADSLRASTSTQQSGDFESFQARFQSYVNQVPPCLHPMEKPGFFLHFFLGSFSTLLDTRIAEKLNIKKIYFSFDGSKTLKVVVFKKGEIEGLKEAIDRVKLFVIAESDSARKKFSYGDLDKVLGDTGVVRNARIRQARDEGKLSVKLVEITKEKGAKEKKAEISVEVKSSNLGQGIFTVCEFKVIKKGSWDNLESDIAKLTDSKADKVKGSVEEILKKIGKVHPEYRGEFEKEAREAAHYGFITGALMNFFYRHTPRVYLEQFAGRGYEENQLKGQRKKILLPSGFGLISPYSMALVSLSSPGASCSNDGSQQDPSSELSEVSKYSYRPAAKGD
ncbi:OTU-like cysteine protease [Wolbachia endosymbiont of Armadillidium vulgare]|nr:OTU-like cysteine protease [Wolbachia endosymbiont of Armadillidium vulgare]